MAHHRIVAALGAAAVLLGAGAAVAADCRIEQHGEMKLTMVGRQPVVAGDIGGKPIRAIVDTGAWATTLTEDAAQRLGLRVVGSSVRTSGVGGVLRTGYTTVASLHIANLTAKDLTLPVSGTAPDTDMLLGDEFFNRYDLELDLAHGAIRLLTITGCKDDQIPYWGKGAYSLAPLVSRDDSPTRAYIVAVKLNGQPVEAIIDTGAAASVATPDAVRRSGGRIEGGGERMVGLAGRVLPTSVGRLDSFSIGEETIRSPAIAVAPINAGVAWTSLGSRIAVPGDEPRMLLGTDFLLAHRVLLSASRGKAYFTYEGGPVFAPVAADAPGASKSPVPAPASH